MNRTRLVAMAATLALSAPLATPATPALANGAASTRNIILGGAALTAGTLIWLNHNKKVHEKYAEYDRRQAQTEAQANGAEAAYESERQAYGHEAALVSAYQKTISYQHGQVVARDRQIASLERSLRVAKYGANRPVASAPRAAAAVASLPADRRVFARRSAAPANVVSYGWGQF